MLWGKVLVANGSSMARRLDGIERKLDRMMEELRTPTAIGYSGTQGQSSKGGLKAQRSKVLE